MADNADAGANHDRQKGGTDKPWQDPGQSAQNPYQKPTKPDLERLQDTDTH